MAITMCTMPSARTFKSLSSRPAPAKLTNSTSMKFKRSVVARFTVTVQDPYGAAPSTFSCSDRQTILEAAMAAGVELPSLCHTGACQACTGKLVSGAVCHTDESTLEQSQRDLGYALLCCSQPQSDITILAEQELAMHAEMCK